MKILVTGGAGYIGSITAELLLDAGYTVAIYDNLEKGHRQAIDERASFIHGDLRDSTSINKAICDFLPDAVIHFAAYAYVGESMECPEKYFRNNVTGGINLAEAMLKNNIKRIIFSSTCASYGEPESMPIDETCPQKPANAYGDSKLMFERILLWYQQIYGIQPVFLRYFNASGATEKFGEDHNPEPHIIPLTLQVALGKKDKLYIFGDDYDTRDGTCIRDYIHIADLAQAHILALEKGVTGAFNLGNGDGYSVKEVIDIAREITGHPIPTEIQPRRAGDPPQLIASAEKAKKILGWQPKYPELKTIIQHAWNWHKSHPDGYSFD